MAICLILIALLGSVTGLEADKVGIVHMHGFWQAFDEQHHLDFKDFVEEKTGVKVHLIDAFNDLAMPPAESSITPLNVQVPAILKMVKNIAAQYDKIIAVGFSQGGVIWRAMIESWDDHNVDTFISIAAPQSGQAGIPPKYLASLGNLPFVKMAQSQGKTISEADMKLLPYDPRVQQVFAPSNYYRNPATYKLYLKTNFFPKLNNEIGNKKEKRKQKNNFERLRKLVLIGGPDEETIVPWQSEMFGFISADQNIITMKKTKFYKKNLFGLKTLDKKDAITRCIKGGLKHNDFPNSSEVLNDCVLPAIQDVLNA